MTGHEPARLDRRALLGAAVGLGAVVTGCGSPPGPQSSGGAPDGGTTSTTKTGSAQPPAAPSPGHPSQSDTPSPANSPSAAQTSSGQASSAPHPASNAEILARSDVPVLCWHQLRNWTSSDSSYDRRLLICPPKNFRAQLDALAEDNWTTIGPDQYLAHLTTGVALPKKSVLLTFDDSQRSQITEGLPQLYAHEMTATFFAMTVVLDKKGWFSRKDLKTLGDGGMIVAAHTWDHHRVDQYSGRDWSTQLEQPKALLEKIIGKPVDHFAYPYGAWNRAALLHVKAAGYKSAYQLADRKPDRSAPLLTLRRDLVDSTWTGKQLLAHLRRQTS